MLDALRRFFAGNPGAGSAAPGDEDELRVAACALLLELAHSDDTFSPDEQGLIEGALGRHFGLTPEEGRELLALAEERRRAAVDLHEFTRIVSARYDEGQRMVLAELMWRVVDADGELSRHEEALMRKLGSLLDLRPGYLAVARKRSGHDPA